MAAYTVSSRCCFCAGLLCRYSLLKCVHIFWDTRCISTYFLHKSSLLLHDHPIAFYSYLRENRFLTTKLFLILRVRLFWPVAQLHITRLAVNRLWPPALRLHTLLSAVMKPVSPLAINWLRWCKHGLTVQTPINRQEISVSCLTVHATAFPQFQTVFRSDEICRLDRMVGTTGEGTSTGTQQRAWVFLQSACFTEADWSIIRG